VSQPYFFGLIVTTSTGNTDESRRNVIYYTVFLLIILIIGGIFTVLRGWCFGLIGERIVRNIRVSLFEKITTLDISFFDENNTGDLVSRLTSDTAAIQSCLSVNVSIGLRSLAQVLISIIILGLMSWKLTLVLLGIVPILLLVSVGYGRYTKKLSKDYQDALAAAAESASESMSNARIMRAYSSEEMETSRYKNKIEISYMKG
jgi:ABC-type multidrug transport system fused ATPase/permease subunit